MKRARESNLDNVSQDNWVKEGDYSFRYRSRDPEILLTNEVSYKNFAEGKMVQSVFIYGYRDGTVKIGFEVRREKSKLKMLAQECGKLGLAVKRDSDIH